MKIDTFKQQIQSVIMKYFPESYIHISDRQPLSSSDVLVKFAIGKDVSEWPGEIINNDASYHVIWFEECHKDGVLLDKKAKLRISIGCCLNGPNSVLLEKIPFRKSTANPETLLKSFDRYFKRLAEAYNKHEHELAPQLQGKCIHGK